MSSVTVAANDLADLARHVDRLNELAAEHHRLYQEDLKEIHSKVKTIMELVRALDDDRRARRRLSGELRRTKDENRRLKRRVSHLLRALEAGDTDSSDDSDDD